MEYLDYYDEDGNYLGTASREEVHASGLWHKTVQNWLYTRDGKVLFQIRKDLNKFYTTASGHVKAGESVEEAFAREINEEIGLTMNAKNAKMIELVTWIKDKVKDGVTVMKDRAQSSFYIIEYKGDFTDFKFDENEVLGIGIFDAKKLYKILEDNYGEIDATIITSNGQEEKKVTLDDFVVLSDETAMDKYGNVLRNIIEITNK